MRCCRVVRLPHGTEESAEQGAHANGHAIEDKRVQAPVHLLVLRFYTFRFVTAVSIFEMAPLANPVLTSNSTLLSPPQLSSQGDATRTIIFGTLAAVASIITICQGHRNWELWRTKWRVWRMPPNADSLNISTHTNCFNVIAIALLTNIVSYRWDD